MYSQRPYQWQRVTTVFLFLMIGTIILCAQAVSAQTNAQEFLGVNTCPAGYNFVSLQEAKQNKAQLCKLLNESDIVRLGDGASLSGPGYDCAIIDKDTRTLGGALCEPLIKCGAATTKGDVLNFNCPALPNPILSTTPDFDTFAWNTFIAANWPAIEPDKGNKNLRGQPNQSLAFATNNKLRVWETWKEKRELFIYGKKAGDPVYTEPAFKNWNSQIDYHNATEGIKMCSGGAVKAGARVIPQSAKNSLDETLEVPSEARETPDQLCGKASGYCTSNPNEACCLVHGLAVEPRVWSADPKTNPDQLVRFEVKLNYDYWNYVVQKQYYLDSVIDAAIAKEATDQKHPYPFPPKGVPVKGTQIAPVRLPYRISSPTLFGEKQNTDSATGYSALSCLSSTTTPCKAGAIQTKSAWILNPSPPSDYHTTQALYYSTNAGGDTCFKEGTFGLVGLHIIQRFHGSGGTNVGAFLFASWEHNSVEKKPNGFYYSNYLKKSTTITPPGGKPVTVQPGFYPPLDKLGFYQFRLPLCPVSP